MIKRTLSDIEAVKEKMMGSSQEIKEKKKQLRKKVKVMRNRETYSLSEETAERFLDSLDNCKHLEILVARLNRVNFLQEVLTVQERVDGLVQFVVGQSSGKMVVHAQQDILENRLKPLSHHLEGLGRLLSEGDLDRFTQQQVEDMVTEVIRLGMVGDAADLLVCNLAWWDKNPADQQVLFSFDDLIRSQKPLTRDEEDEAKDLLSQVRKALGISEPTALGISDRERLHVVHAMGLSQGHWFKCKQGHVYAIGECGGAMAQGKCPECGDVIGGKRHHLTEGNVFAGEMDQSKHSAWSKET